MNGEKEGFNFFEIPVNKKRNLSTTPLPTNLDVVHSSEGKKSNVFAPNIASKQSAKTPEREQTPVSAQVSLPITATEPHPSQPAPPTQPNPPRSRLSGFSLPLFSSTPLNTGIFSQKRRTSSKKGRKNVAATSPASLNEIAQESSPKTPNEDKKGVDEIDSVDPKKIVSDNAETPTTSLDKSVPGLKVSPPRSPKETHARTPLSAEKAFDLEDLHRTQRSLLRLLDDFNSGKMKVFHSPSANNAMKQVREKQERLAKLHFELYAAQDHLGVSTDSARSSAYENLQRLMTNLQDLNGAIQILDSDTRPITPSK